MDAALNARSLCLSELGVPSRWPARFGQPVLGIQRLCRNLDWLRVFVPPKLKRINYFDKPLILLV